MSWIILKGDEGYFYTNNGDSIKEEIGKLILAKKSFTLYKVAETLSVSAHAYVDAEFKGVQSSSFLSLFEMFFAPKPLSTEKKNHGED